MLKSPPKLGEWIDEDVTVTVNKPVFDGKSVRFEKKEETITEKAIYFNAPKIKVMCRENEHSYIPTKPNQFVCEKCAFMRIAHPVTYKYDPGSKKLLPRTM